MTLENELRYEVRNMLWLINSENIAWLWRPPTPNSDLTNLPYGWKFKHSNQMAPSILSQNMLVSLDHLTTFTFTQLPDWFLTFRDTVSDKDCRKGKFLPLWFFVFLKVWYICQFLFSKLGKGILDFSFSSRNWRKEFRFLFLLSKLSKKIRDFSFSSRDEAKEFGFLFLFSKLVKGN